MRNNFLKRTLPVACLAAAAVWAQNDDDVRALPLSMTTQVDAGQVVKGDWNGGNIDDQFIQRTSVWLTQEIQIGKRLDVRAGVGGLFWYAVPTPGAGITEAGRFAQLPKFGPGITRADMVYRFSDEPNPMFTLQAGFFPYKYNPDASNLGEYLLRSGAYPGNTSTGGWNLMGNAYMMQGLRLNVSLWGGKFQSEFLLPMERDLPPNNDLSPTYIGTVMPIRGLEFGGGVSCHHCISVRPSRTSPEVGPNRDFSTYGFGSGYVRRNPGYNPALATTAYNGTNPKYVFDSTSFYSFQGIKLMARTSFDPKAYITLPMLGSEDLKIFAEVALLGLENRPFYYEKRSERMPVMFGINLPTFRALDLLSFQMEYYGSRFPNSLENAVTFQMPTLSFQDSNGIVIYDPNFYDPNNKALKDDDWKWSVVAKKQIIKGLNLYAVAANDNMRLPFWTATPSWQPVTNKPKDWYYLVRFELGI